MLARPHLAASGRPRGPSVYLDRAKGIADHDPIACSRGRCVGVWSDEDEDAHRRQQERGPATGAAQGPRLCHAQENYEGHAAVQATVDEPHAQAPRKVPIDLRLLLGHPRYRPDIGRPRLLPGRPGSGHPHGPVKIRSQLGQREQHPAVSLGSGQETGGSIGIFRRGGADSDEPEKAEVADVGELLLQGHDMIRQTAAAHDDRWGLGTAERWDLDQTAVTLRWTFADKVVEAPAQLLGLYSPADSTWTWAWASRSVPPSLSVDSEVVRSWGEQHGQRFLVQPTAVLTDERVADVVAVAFRLSGATGFYRGPAGSVVAYMTFGPVTIMPNEGEEEHFAIAVQ